MGLTPAARVRDLGQETAFEVLSRARALEAQGRHVVHLEIGEPDFDSPAHVVAAGQRALADGHTHYGPGAGLPALRRAVADYVARTRGVEVAPERVVITPGAKPVMAFAVLALVEPGDEVLYPDPGFPIYESLVRFVGGMPVPVPLREERGFRFDPAEFRSLVTDRTRLLILNSPHNPTGGVLAQADLAAIAAEARERDLVVLADEIYGRLLYDGEHHSLLALEGMQDRVILLDGWSKTYAMTGWRLGFGVFPAWLMPHVERLISNTVSCTATFSQLAAQAALEGPQDAVDTMLAEFRRRRDVMVPALQALPGVRCTLPRGAFYAFPNIAGTGFTSRELADRLLEEAGVACLSGTAFGAGGEGFLRLSYATAMPDITLALERIARFLASAEPRSPSSPTRVAGPALAR